MLSSTPQRLPADRRPSKASLPSSPNPTPAILHERGARGTCIVPTFCVFCIGSAFFVCEVLFNFTHTAFLNTVTPDNVTAAERTTTPAVQDAPPRALLDALPLADGRLLWNFLSDESLPNITSAIYCMYDPLKSNRDSIYRLYNMPLAFCTAVIFCCAGISQSNYTLRFYEKSVEDHESQPLLVYFSEFLSLRMYRKSEYRLFIAIGGPPSRYRELAKTLPASSMIMRNLDRDVTDFGIDGVALYVTSPDLFPVPELLSVFLESHRRYRFYMIAFLPMNPEVHDRYFNVTWLMEDEFIRFVQISHPFVKEVDYVTCPSPKWTPYGATSMKVLQRDLQLLYSRVWGRLSSRLLYTVSFLGYSFLAEKPASQNNSATLLDNVTYAEACAAVRSRKWKGEFNYETDCFVASRGGLFMATPGPESYAFLNDEFTGNGVVVFDLFSDDYRGVCGVKYPLSQAIRNAFSNRTIRKWNVSNGPPKIRY